jgi:hypothetical protein
MVSQIERSFKMIFGIRFSVKQLREIIPRLKQFMDSPTPKARRRCDIMEWMGAAWIRTEPSLHEINKRGTCQTETVESLRVKSPPLTMLKSQPVQNCLTDID